MLRNRVADIRSARHVLSESVRTVTVAP
jgi:hypothetical protein